jgi:hypothetical protein
MKNNRVIYEFQWEEQYRGSSIVGYSDAWSSPQKLSENFFTEEEAKNKWSHRECTLNPILHTKRIRK